MRRRNTTAKALNPVSIQRKSLDFRAAEIDTDADADALRGLGLDVGQLITKLGGFDDLGKKFAV